MATHHYLERVPLNGLVAVPSKGVGRARKRHLTLSELTYVVLKDLLTKKAELGTGPSLSSLANLHSALSGFLQERGIKHTDAIGSTFRASYYKNLQAHIQSLKDELRPSAYITNRKHLLSIWRKCVVEHDRNCALTHRHVTPFQAALLDIFNNGVTKTLLRKNTGIPKATLNRWCDGQTPNATSLHYVPRIENFLGLRNGELSELLPIKRQSRDEKNSSASIAYRERQKALRIDRYAVTEPTPRLRSEWSEFLQYKVSELDFDDDEASIKRSSGGRWRSTSQTSSKQRPSNWASWYKSRRVATAGIAWTNVSQFLGWLMLSEERGGKNLSPEAAQTLGHFTNRQWIREFVEWKRLRAGGNAHQGLLSFLRFVSSLCNPRTGYLTQRFLAFGPPTGATEEMWRARCLKCFDSISRFRAELSDDATPSRDSREPIRNILALENPLDAVADMVTRMASARPITGGKREAIWARDMLLIKLTASNPLRDKNIRELTYRADNTGQLRQTATGEWSIFVRKQELKNQNGVARDRDYDMPVRPEVWPDIERYLKQYRPMLAKSKSDVLFLTERWGGPFSEDALGQRFHILTKNYLHGCPGVGPHALRHIVATSILKASPNDWAAAAWALHDDEATVRKHYAHLAQHDAARWLSKAMDGPFSRM